MTKQEKIKEGIRNLIDNNYNGRNPSYPELIAFQPMKFLNELLPYLHSQGVAIKVDRELPKCCECDGKGLIYGEPENWRTITICPTCYGGLVSVESLIKEK